MAIRASITATTLPGEQVVLKSSPGSDRRDEYARALPTIQHAFACQLADCLAQRGAAHAKLRGQGGLTWKAVSQWPFAAPDAVQQYLGGLCGQWVTLHLSDHGTSLLV